MKKRDKTWRKLVFSIVLIVLLSIALVGTAFAMAYSIVRVDENAFFTGRVSINLNNGQPVITEDEYLFEPGMTVTKQFFIQNNSTWDVYYKLYLDNLGGDLSRVIEVTIADGDKILYDGMAVSLSKTKVSAADDYLKVGEIRQLTLTLHFPEEAGNEYQDADMYFDLCSEAVQTKNNPDKLFD